MGTAAGMEVDGVLAMYVYRLTAYFPHPHGDATETKMGRLYPVGWADGWALERRCDLNPLTPL